MPKRFYSPHSNRNQSRTVNKRIDSNAVTMSAMGEQSIDIGGAIVSPRDFRLEPQQCLRKCTDSPTLSQLSREVREPVRDPETKVERKENTHCIQGAAFRHSAYKPGRCRPHADKACPRGSGSQTCASSWLLHTGPAGPETAHPLEKYEQSTINKGAPNSTYCKKEPKCVGGWHRLPWISFSRNHCCESGHVCVPCFWTMVFRQLLCFDMRKKLESTR